MICPHCEYDDIEDANEFGKHGQFFTLPIKFRRQQLFYSDQERTVYACPQCLKVFISDY